MHIPLIVLGKARRDFVFRFIGARDLAVLVGNVSVAERLHGLRPKCLLEEGVHQLGTAPCGLNGDGINALRQQRLSREVYRIALPHTGQASHATHDRAERAILSIRSEPTEARAEPVTNTGASVLRLLHRLGLDNRRRLLRNLLHLRLRGLHLLRHLCHNRSLSHRAHWLSILCSITLRHSRHRLI